MKIWFTLLCQLGKLATVKRFKKLMIERYVAVVVGCQFTL